MFHKLNWLAKLLKRASVLLTSKPEEQSRFIFEEMEPRKLFSADPLGGLLELDGFELPQVEMLIIDHVSESTENYSKDSGDFVSDEQLPVINIDLDIRRELVFIDSTIENHDQLLDDLISQGSESRIFSVFVLDGQTNGIDQITEELQNHDDIDALHIISHGSPGAVSLGNTQLNSNNLNDYASQISLWQNSFDQDADILIYGCELVGNEAGELLTTELSTLTATDVAASVDDTGSAAQGGDWELEFSTGVIETQIAISEQTQQSWGGLLAFETYRDEFDTTSFANTHGSKDWANTPWQEIGENDGASAGHVMVSAGGNVIYGSGDNGLYREVDLSGATNASLSFDYAATSLDDSSREVFLEISDDGGGTWSELEHWVGSGTDVALTNTSYDISAFISNNTQIRFRTLGFVDNSDQFFVDNFQVAYVSDLVRNSEFLVNQNTAGIQETSGENRGSHQSVAVASNGDYVVVWTEVESTGDLSDVFAQQYNADGTIKTAAFQVNTTSVDEQQWASVASDASGRFVITWTSVNQDGSGEGVYLKRFNAEGTEIDNTDILVNAWNTNGDQSNASVALNSQGNMVVSWQSAEAGNEGIFSRIFDMTSAAVGSVVPGTLITVGTNANSIAPTVDINSEGKFVTTWSLDTDTYFRTFNSDGSYGSAQIKANFSESGHLAVVILESGEIITTDWVKGFLGLGRGVWVDAYANNGVKITSHYISNSSKTMSSISKDLDGNIIVVYQGGGDGSGSGVFAQKFDSNLNNIQSQFRVNETVDGVQRMASVAMLDHDNFIVVWSGNGADDTNGVFARQYHNVFPALTSPLISSINENSSFVQDLTATDADGDTVIFSISGGHDASLFEIDAFNGLHFISAPDFELPTDFNLDNVYQVEITANDGHGGTDIQQINISINNINDTHFSGSATAIWSDSGLSTAQAADFNGIHFTDESNTADIGGPWTIITGAEAPTRDEKIVIGVDNTGNLSGQMWNGTSWSVFTFNDFSTVSDITKWGFSVAYESQTGNAVMVWNNGSVGTNSLSYRVWDGSTWSATTVMTSPLAGEAQQIKLAAAPDSNHMVLIVSNDNNQDYAMVWDGTNWGNGIVLAAVSGINNTDISVIYEQQSGDAIVIYDSGMTNPNYRVWDGISWSIESAITAPAGVTASTIWTTVAADQNSDKIVLGAISNSADNETWLSIWDGDAWVASLLATENEVSSGFLGVTVAFESESGNILAVYSQGNNHPGFRTWNSIDGWFGESDVTTLDNLVRTVSLVSRPETNQIMLTALDVGGDAHFISWDGRMWGDKNVLETNTGQTLTQPLFFLWDQNPSSLISKADFLLSTLDDVNSSGAAGLNAWSEGELLQFGNPGLQLEPVSGETTGALFANFNLDTFGDGNTGIDSIHYVSNNIQMGASNFNLFEGDLLISTETNESLPGLFVTKEDVFIFRPDTSGDYSSGTFFMLLENPIGSNIQGITLIEQNTLIGDYTVQAGDFLIVDGSNKIFLWETNQVGSGQTNGSQSILINGTDSNISITKELLGIDLIENTTLIGGHSLSSGTLILTTAHASTIGSNNISVEKWDLFSLQVTHTTLNAGNNNGAVIATLILQGNDIGLSNGKEALSAVTTVAQNNPPTADTGTYVIDEGNSIALDGANSSDPDLDNLTFSWDLNNDMVYGDVVGENPVISWPTLQSYGINDGGVYTIGLQVDDGYGGIDSTTTEITVNNINHVPVITDQSFTLLENSLNGSTVGSVIATDPDAGDNLSFTITVGNDLNTFAISSTGVITVADSSQLDFETTSTFNLTVKVTDDGIGHLSDTAVITINLSDVNELPVITNQTFTLPENSLNGSIVGTVFATDSDAGDNLSFSIITGNDLNTFAISSTGVITVADSNQLDFETISTFNLTVKVTDDGIGHLNDTGVITINLSGVNELPIIINQTFMLPENSLNGSIVGTVFATDPDAGDYLSFSITTGNDLNIFTISSTGVITIADSSQLDFETFSMFNLTVQVTDDGIGTLISTAVISINISPINGLPIINDQSFLLAENSQNGNVVGTVIASDPDVADSLSYSITAGNRLNAFSINNVTGEITVADSNQLDYETTPIFNLTVQVTDNGVGHLSNTATISIGLTDINETPNSISLTNNFIDEHLDTSAGVTIGSIISSDEDAHSYQIVGGIDQGKFLIGGSSHNELILNDGVLDFENQSSYQVTVSAIDSRGISHEEIFTINVNNLNEQPVITSGNSITLAENKSNVTTVVAEDQNQPEQSLSYSLSGGADRALFLLDNHTGELSFKAAPDFESPVDSNRDNTYSIEITVNDGNGGIYTQLLSIQIEDVAEAPNLLDQSVVLDGQSNDGALVSTLIATDPDNNESFSYRIVGGNELNAFVIDGTGNLIVSNPKILINQDSSIVSLVIQVTDSQGLTDTSTVQIDIQELQNIRGTEPENVVKNEGEFSYSILTEMPSENSKPISTKAIVTESTLSEPIEAEDMISRTDNMNFFMKGDNEMLRVIGESENDITIRFSETIDRFDNSQKYEELWAVENILIKAKAFIVNTKIIPQFSYFEIETKVLQFLTEESGFMQSLDLFREIQDEVVHLEKTVVGSSITVTTGLSIGYVIWLVRGGVLLSTALSSLPAWRMVDPLPVITSLNNISTDDEKSGDSLASLIKKGGEVVKLKLSSSH